MAELKDVVILNITDYNKLRDFRNEIIKREKHVFSMDRSYSYTFYSDDEAIKQIERYNASLLLANSELRKENEALVRYNKESTRLGDEQERSKLVSELKNMSIWQFLKWRKQHR